MDRTVEPETAEEQLLAQHTSQHEVTASTEEELNHPEAEFVGLSQDEKAAKE